ncbi:MAG: hypothetical protein HQ579_01085, partial [Candidatus Omnitrophica bacterium]|nr:hypothetical protein [Candidatus Omnitrophota bacterium]
PKEIADFFREREGIYAGDLAKAAEVTEEKVRRGNFNKGHLKSGTRQEKQEEDPEAIMVSILNELGQKQEVSPQALFTLVQSKVPESMQDLRAALENLRPLSEQKDVTQDQISDAIAKAKEKHDLSEEEEHIIWFALTGPGQGMDKGEEGAEREEEPASAESKDEPLYETLDGLGMTELKEKLKSGDLNLYERVSLAFRILKNNLNIRRQAIDTLAEILSLEEEGSMKVLESSVEGILSSKEMIKSLMDRYTRDEDERGAENMRNMLKGLNKFLEQASERGTISKEESERIEELGKTKRRILINLYNESIFDRELLEAAHRLLVNDKANFALSYLISSSCRYLMKSGVEEATAWGKERLIMIIDRESENEDDEDDAVGAIEDLITEGVKDPAIIRGIRRLLKSKDLSKRLCAVRFIMDYKAVDLYERADLALREVYDVAKEDPYGEKEKDNKDRLISIVGWIGNYQITELKDILLEQMGCEDVYLRLKVYRSLIRLNCKEEAIPSMIQFIYDKRINRPSSNQLETRNRIAFFLFVDECGIEFDIPKEERREIDGLFEAGHPDESIEGINRLFDASSRKMLLKYINELIKEASGSDKETVKLIYDLVSGGERKTIDSLTAWIVMPEDPNRVDQVLDTLRKKGLSDREIGQLLRGLLKIKKNIEGFSDGDQDASFDTAFSAGAGEEAQATTNPTTQLFEIIEEAANNRRGEFVNTANELMSAVAEQQDLDVEIEKHVLDKEQSTTELKDQVEKIIATIDSLDIETLPEDMASSVAQLKKDLDQFEADSIVSSIIALARRAKKEGQNLIIGLETDWIPGYQKGSLQYNAINSLILELGSLGDTLRSLGLDNVVVVHSSQDELAGDILREADKTSTKLSNIVVLASNNTINSEAFHSLRSTASDERAFIAGINPSELIKFYSQNQESMDKQLTIQIMSMLSIALELALGKEAPNLPIIATYDKTLRMVIFLPKAVPVDYQELQKRYRLKKLALHSA